jgi:hypothetical protein
VNITLHLFTNASAIAPSTDIIQNTVRSFRQAFGALPVTVWYDPKPNTRHATTYEKALRKLYRDIRPMNGLSDGYIRAITRTESDWLFMLEHDWEFQPAMIKHSLDEIIKVMESDEIYHLRFNKRANEVAGWDVDLHESGQGDFLYCKTDILSNNPHILNRKKYLDFIRRGYIVRKPGSKGIEEVISVQPDTWGAIYGPLGYPQTVRHTDGRKAKRGLLG